MDTTPTTYPHTFTDTLKHVPTDRLYPNPWQTRIADDPAHVASLAEDILANGLLQPPLARPDPAHHGYYELAFGHSRFAAWLKLYTDGRHEFDAFPVHVRALSDRQMADLAAAENARRKDLSAIETARALQARIEAFHLTQAEAGQAFGLSQSAVANLLRLLKLPAGVQDLVHAGELPEREARKLVALVPVAEEAVLDLANDLVAAETADEREELLEDGIDTMVRQHAQRLSNVLWDLSEPVGDLPACESCPNAIKLSNWDVRHCTNAACYQAKHDYTLRAELGRIVQKTGIPAAADGEQVTVLTAGSATRKQALEENEARALLKGGKKQAAALGLRWVAAEEPAPWYAERVYGSAAVLLATVDIAAVTRHLRGANGNGKAEPAAAAVPAQDDSEREEREKEARRIERGAKLKLEADLTWLMRSASEWIGDALDVHGGALDFMLDVQEGRTNWGAAAELPDLRQYDDQLKQEIKLAEKDLKAGGRLDSSIDIPRRRRLALHWLVNEVLNEGFGMHAGLRDSDAWKKVCASVERLATIGKKGQHESQRPGLGLKLPIGWNHPPVHRTTYNCWQCGEFAPHKGNLNGADLGRGWIDGGARGVYCCEEHRKLGPAGETVGQQADRLRREKQAKPAAKRSGGRKAAAK